ncbi:MAG: hypothetical protein AAB490_02240 [Patescibacteria group bacterium]
MKFALPSWVLYAAVPAVIVGAFVIDLNPSGVRRLRSSLDESSVMISPLFPAQRLFGVEDGRQRVKTEPVYFRVRYPRGYHEAVVTVSVDNPASLEWEIGLESEGGEWSYDLKKPDSNGSAQFNLRSAKITDHSLRFIIAVPAMTSDTVFSVDDIDVIFSGKL